MRPPSPSTPPPPPPPWECDYEAEGSPVGAARSTSSWLLLVGFLAWLISLIVSSVPGAGGRPRQLLAVMLLVVLLAAASVPPALYVLLEWDECGFGDELGFTNQTLLVGFSNLVDGLLPVVWSVFLFYFAVFSCVVCLLVIRAYRKRLALVEGDLPSRLRDGSLRLLRVEWLLAQPSDWVLERRQDLPETAFWSPADALRLLTERRVAALSYRWLGATQNDPARFHLNAVLAYYCEERQRVTKHPAILIDFASLPQVEPASVTAANPWGSRTPEDQAIFNKGLYVMPNMYASPRVLVLQQKRMPPDLEEELAAFGGRPPEDHSRDLRPYAGEHCRSGWCTSEAGCVLLVTEGGGHGYELGVGKVPVHHGVLPSEEQMVRLFHDDSTRFANPKDREVVSKMYLDLRKKVIHFENASSTIWRTADVMLTGNTHRQRLRRVSVLLFPWLLPILLPSRILRAHLAAVLCCRSRDRLEYTFHWSLFKPPFRRRPHLASGLKWQKAATQPKGVELTHGALAEVLNEKREFTAKEWQAFGIIGLHLDHFVKSGDSYYVPFDIPDCFLPTISTSSPAHKNQGAVAAKGAPPHRSSKVVPLSSEDTEA